MRKQRNKISNKNYIVDNLIPIEEFGSGSPDEFLIINGNAMVWYPDNYHKNKLNKELSELFNDITSSIK